VHPLVRTRRFEIRLSAIALLGLLLFLAGAAQGQEYPAAALADLINAARVDAGLAPYALAPALNAAAQRHADDLVTHNLSSSTGSDGSTPSQRIAQAGYAAWPSATGERFWIGSGYIDSAFAWFTSDPDSQADLFSERFREIGIGVTASTGGQLYIVLDFGARPNVLPVFINDDAPITVSPQVTLHLTNEEAQPEGEGLLSMGRAIEMRISNTPSFEGLAWRPWEPLVDWTLPSDAGPHLVYVQFRDAAGRTSAATDEIVLLGEEGSPTPPPTASPTPTATPTATPTPGETPSPTPPTPSPSPPPPLPTPRPSPTLPATAHPFPTWTPLPPTDDGETGGTETLVGALCGLQTLAALLGLYAALRRVAPGGQER